ncbi:MAG: hypothetical protein NTX59_13465 [Elusimicrobia bacterium]|nr:hypothetical protein [Elusimicrobiota bacterium]
MNSSPLTEDVLNYYSISDYEKEILRYQETWKDRFADKPFSAEEIDTGLKEGFFIGERKSHIGDYLTYTNVPRMLKEKYKGCRVFAAPHRFAEEVFKLNPYVDSIRDIPGREPAGAFREFGFGNSHQRRLRVFGIYTTEEPAPELYCSQRESDAAAEWRSKVPKNKKVLLVHTSGRTVGNVLSWFAWNRIFKKTRDQIHWVQFGFPGDQKIPCHERLWDVKSLGTAAALMKQADLFIGPNSAPMHLFAFHRKPAVILHNEIRSNEIVFPILGDNFVLPQPVNHHCQHCYSFHMHLCIAGRQKRNPFKQPLEKKYKQGVDYSEELLVNIIKEKCIR